MTKSRIEYVLTELVPDGKVKLSAKELAVLRRSMRQWLMLCEKSLASLC